MINEKTLLIMKKFIYLFFVLAVLLQCSKTEVAPETVVIPTITTFSPTEGTTGTSITINGTNSVSYTHLDVYKRQATTTDSSSIMMD